MNKILILCSIVQTIIDLTKWTSHHHKMWLSIESFDAYVCHCGLKHVFFSGKGLNILTHVDCSICYIIYMRSYHAALTVLKLSTS